MVVALALAAAASVVAEAETFLFLVTSSSAGKLMREKTLAFCLRSAPVAAADGALEEVLFTGSDDIRDEDSDW